MSGIPSTVDSSISFSEGMSNGRSGPWYANGRLYGVFVDRTANTLEVWSSSDAGATWTEQDSANHKTTNSTAGHHSFDSQLVGTTIYIAYNAASDVITIVPFDCTTNTFGTVITGGPTAVVDGKNNYPIFLCRRSDGSYIVAYNGANETVMSVSRRRVKIRRYSGGAWQTEVDLGGTGSATDYDMKGIALGNSDRVHLFYTATATTSNATTPTNGLNARTYLSTNAFNATAATNIISDASVLPVAAVPLGAGSLNGTEVMIPGQDASSNTILIRGSNADTPVWTLQTFSTSKIFVGCGSAVPVSGVIHTVWGTTSGSPLWSIYRDQDSGTGTWGTDTAVEGVADQTAGTLTATAGGTSYSIQGGSSVGSNEQVGQSFQLSNTTRVNGVTIAIAKVSTPTDNLFLDIMDSLTGNVLATSDAVAGSGLLTSATWTYFNFSDPPTLNKSTTYYIVLRRSGTRDTSNYYTWNVLTTNPNATGTSWRRDTGSWANPSASDDCNFRIPGDFNNAVLTLAQAQLVANNTAIGVFYLGAGPYYQNSGIARYTSFTISLDTYNVTKPVNAVYRM